jgi:hypothetical protein
MHTDTTPKEMPAGSVNYPAGHTDSPILPTAQELGNLQKDFATLRAQFALRGHRLECTFHVDSKEPAYYAERWGQVRYLPTLDAVRQFLVQIGGAA